MLNGLIVPVNAQLIRLVKTFLALIPNSLVEVHL